MGCDIHAFVEYKAKDSDTWQSFGEEFHLDRIYGMFAKLAGVRNYAGYNITPLSEPRGFPSNAGHNAFDEYVYYISEHGGEDNVTVESAEEYVNKGYSIYLRDKKFVSQPDWHSASWVTMKEWEQCVNEIWPDGNNWGVEYFAILDLLKSFENRGYETRVIFWFDN